MATTISHAVAALGIGSCCYKPEIPKSIWVAGAFCAILPDLDVIGFPLGVHYGDFWGHRGFTHSLVFAVLLGGIFTFGFRHTKGIKRPWLFLYFFAATASHGLLDAMTNGGLGVAFFSPFDTHRYFLPWRPILVSPIAVSKFLAPRVLAILYTELLWVWLPSAAFSAMVLLSRWRLGARSRKEVKAAGAGNRT